MPRWLWISAFLLGFVYLSLIPPFQIADEPEHLARAYQFSSGKLFAEKRENRAGGTFPASVANGFRFLSRVVHQGDQRVDFQEVKQEFFHGLKFQDSTGRTDFYPFSNMAMYSPAPYLPQILAVGVGRILNLTIVQGMYLARLLTYAVTLLLLVYALSLLGKGTRLEWQLFLLLSLPMALSHLASSSADSISLALAVLNLALMARVFAEPEEKKWLGLFLVTAFFLSLTKLVLFVIPLVAVVPLSFHSWKQRKWDWKILYISVAALLPNILWSLLVRESYTPARLDAPIHAFQQLDFVREHPGSLLSAIWYSLKQYGGDFLSQFVGTLGWLDVPVRFSKAYFYVFTFGVIGMPQFARENVWEGVPGFKTSAIAFACVGGFLVFFTQYLAWTPLGAGHVEGVVGRYFLPVAVLFLAALPGLRFRHRGWEWIFYRLVVACWFFIQMKAIWAVFKRYWMV